MIEFSADTSGFSSDMLEQWFEQYTGRIMDAVATEARDKWIELAEQSGLTVAKEAYVEGIGAIQKPSATERTISLEGFLPNALENGLDPFDMKPGLLQGRNSRVIPILYGKPGQTEKTPLPAKTYSKVKNLKRGERFSTKLGKSKYEGLQKARKSDGRSSFVQFKTVSVNSDPGSWIHPGLDPMNLEEQVKAHIDENMDSIIRSVKGFGK